MPWIIIILAAGMFGFDVHAVTLFAIYCILFMAVIGILTKLLLGGR